MYKTYELSNALALSQSKHNEIEAYNNYIKAKTIDLLVSIGVSKNTIDKWLKSDIPDFTSADDFCKKVRKPHKFIDVLSREECEELILAYVVLSAESNARVKKSYQQMEYEYDYMYRYKEHPIESLGMASRTVNVLRRYLNNYISSEEAFLSLKENTIKYTKGAGVKAVKDILEAQRKLREKEIKWGGNIRNEISESN